MKKIDWFTDKSGARYTLDKQKCGIYKITNPLGQVYVGQSVNMMKRVVGHKCNKKTESKIAKSIIQFGFEAHVFQVLEFCEKEELKDKERYWQDFYQSDGDSGLNIMLTKTLEKKGKGVPGRSEVMKSANTGSKRPNFRHSDEFIEFQRQRLRSAPLNPHHNRKKLIQLTKDGEFIKEWSCLTEACAALGINRGNTGNCANGKYPSSGGFKWKYKKEYEKV